MEDGPDIAFLEKHILPLFKRLRTYSRLKVSGLENIPESGPVLFVGNHTGWLGLDYAFTALTVWESQDRLVRGLAHAAWFAAPATAKFARRAGIIQISKEALKERLMAGDAVMMFPEGEKGAFSVGSDYKLEEFARGFVRVALELRVPVIPVCILGGEEANPVGTRIESYEELLNLKGGLPIPRNLIPKPVKWRIRFLPSSDWSDYSAKDTGDSELMHKLADETRDRIQNELGQMKLERGHPYF